MKCLDTLKTVKQSIARKISTVTPAKDAGHPNLSTPQNIGRHELAKILLAVKTVKERNKLMWSEMRFYAVYAASATEYLEKCDFSELPLYANHPEELVRLVVKERLQHG